MAYISSIKLLFISPVAYQYKIQMSGWLSTDVWVVEKKCLRSYVHVHVEVRKSIKHI